MGTRKCLLTCFLCLALSEVHAVAVARVFFHHGVVRDRVVFYLSMPVEQVVCNQLPPQGKYARLHVRLPGCMCSDMSAAHDFDKLTCERDGYRILGNRAGGAVSLTCEYDPTRVGVLVHRMNSIGLIPSVSITMVRYHTHRRLSADSQRVVAIDCGHGGWETGALGFGLVEKDLALSVGRMLGDCLRQHGYQVVFTRDRDMFVPLDRRTSVANGRSSDFLISIHHNSSPSPDARGIETFFLDPQQAALVYRTPNVPEQLFCDDHAIKMSERAAQLVHDHLLQTPGCQLVDRGIKNAFSQILFGSEAPVTLLVELMFINNRQDAAILSSTRNLQKFADQLCNGIDAYFQAH